MGLALLSSCRSKSNHSSSEVTAADPIVSYTPPFQTKEPERYQAVRTITFSKAAGELIVTRTSIARDGDRRRDEYETGTTERIVYLDLPDGRFILLPAAKLYAEVGGEASARDSTDQMDGSSAVSPDLLLNADRIETQYQKLGSEVVSGRNTSKYRVLVNTSARGTVRTGESYIWIDETLGMPVKSETVTADGNRTTMELSELVLDVDGGVFQIPGGYKKVAAVAIRERLHQR